MATTNWLDRYQTGRQDFVRIHQRAIGTGLLAATATFFFYLTDWTGDTSPSALAAGQWVLFFLPFFVRTSVRPTTLQILVLPALLVVGLVDQGWFAGAYTGDFFPGLRANTAPILPAACAYATYWFYLNYHALWAVPAGDAQMYRTAYQGKERYPRPSRTGGAGASPASRRASRGLTGVMGAAAAGVATAAWEDDEAFMAPYRPLIADHDDRFVSGFTAEGTSDLDAISAASFDLSPPNSTALGDSLDFAARECFRQGDELVSGSDFGNDAFGDTVGVSSIDTFADTYGVAFGDSFGYEFSSGLTD